jgi:hypothetical protein
MYQYAPVIAGNMLSVARDQAPTLAIPKEFHTLQMVPIGTQRGLFSFNNMVAVEKKAWPQKCEIRDMQIGALAGEAKWVKKANDNATTMPKVFGCASGCCYCVPIHISKARKFNQDNFDKAK